MLFLTIYENVFIHLLPLCSFGLDTALPLHSSIQRAARPRINVHSSFMSSPRTKQCILMSVAHVVFIQIPCWKVWTMPGLTGINSIQHLSLCRFATHERSVCKEHSGSECSESQRARGSSPLNDIVTQHKNVFLGFSWSEANCVSVVVNLFQTRFNNTSLLCHGFVQGPSKHLGVNKTWRSWRCIWNSNFHPLAQVWTVSTFNMPLLRLPSDRPGGAPSSLKLICGSSLRGCQTGGPGVFIIGFLSTAVSCGSKQVP